MPECLEKSLSSKPKEGEEYEKRLRLFFLSNELVEIFNKVIDGKEISPWKKEVLNETQDFFNSAIKGYMVVETFNFKAGQPEDVRNLNYLFDSLKQISKYTNLRDSKEAVQILRDYSRALREYLYGEKINELLFREIRELFSNLEKITEEETSEDQGEGPIIIH